MRLTLTGLVALTEAATGAGVGVEDSVFDGRGERWGIPLRR